jgi:thiol:disulfide interchange protein
VTGIIVAAVAAVVAVAVIPQLGGMGASSSSSSDVVFSERYQPYSEAALAAAGPDDTVVLFFSASWCSTCKVLRDDISANQENIPDDVRILLVDFDDSTELKQQYEVTFQHTLVQVDRTGDGIARWQQSRSLDEILATIVDA